MGGVGALIGALIGALFGAFHSGLTGPEIERRTMPNQRIRQSARNVAGFALIGGLTLGTIWGLLNLLVARLMSGLAPDLWDWLHFWLWCNGTVPWHYPRFLNYATERTQSACFSNESAGTIGLSTTCYETISPRWGQNRERVAEMALANESL